MSELGGGSTWAQCKLEDVCRLVNGRAYKRPELLDDGKYRVLRVGNLFTNGSWFWSDLELDDDKYIDNGDLIYAWSASFGPRIWDGEKVIYHYHIWKCLPNPELLDKHFLYRWFEWDTAKVKADHGTGSTMIHVTKGDMEARPLALPPLPEQRRIVAKLDRLSARTKAARAHLARVQSLSTRAKQATLAAAFRGDLTKDWRDRMQADDGLAHSIATLGLDASERGTWSSEELPPSWEWRKFRESFTDLTDSRRKLPKNKYTEDGDFVVVDQGAELFGGRSDARDLVHTADPPVIIFGDHTRCVKYIDRPFIQGADGVKVLKTAPGMSLRFAFWALNAVELPDKGYSRHMKFLKATAFPVPPSEEQDEIVRRIEAAFARIDRMEEEASRAAHLLDRLDQRLLAKAFRGELVPQDPDDEPAAELLARIEAARAAAPKPKRGRRQRA